MARLRSPEQRGVGKRVQVAFGRLLQIKRKGRLKQDALAEALDVSRTSVSNIERGRHRVFLDQAYLAARALGIPLAELLPTVDEVFPVISVVLEKRSGVGEGSAQLIYRIASTIQQKAINAERGNRRKRRVRK
jgi:transcriptional regulator with XRE-family HTH domain